MIIHDISLTTTARTVTWDGTEQGHSCTYPHRMADGEECNVSVLTQSVHTGTHLDAPLHFLHDGTSVEQLDLNTLVGPAQVVEIYHRAVIAAEDLESAGLPLGTTRVLFKTDNTRRGLLSALQFHTDYVGIDPGGAAWLVARGVTLVGIDYLSVGPYGDANGETHRILLGAGVVLVETLRLDGVKAGKYFLAALPPKFGGLEASPCRAILIEGEIETL